MKVLLHLGEILVQQRESITYLPTLRTRILIQSRYATRKIRLVYGKSGIRRGGGAAIACVGHDTVSHLSQVTAALGRVSAVDDDLTEVPRQSVAEPGELDVLCREPGGVVCRPPDTTHVGPDRGAACCEAAITARCSSRAAR
ncbi:hypothetical protein CIB48_g11525 [Xylaria polymorpha]|nr:hypothetical protein CIB48_g11525 [Xylaria polymorpha]